MNTGFIDTSHGRISYVESEGKGPTILMIHGNSTCKEVFRNQMDGQIGKKYHCIAIDLPGHGASENALDGKKTYSMPGYAETACEFMSAKGIKRYFMLGWSLGGHIGLEMLGQSTAIDGLIISGTPPVSKGAESMEAGFLPSEHMLFAGTADITKDQASAYAHATCGSKAPYETFLFDAVSRTHGPARENMLNSFMAGIGHDQRKIAETNKTPLAIINGSDDAFANNDYIKSITYANLWRRDVTILDGIGHAPFWEAPDIFDRHLDAFVSETLT